MRMGDHFQSIHTMVNYKIYNVSSTKGKRVLTFEIRLLLGSENVRELLVDSGRERHGVKYDGKRGKVEHFLFRDVFYLFSLLEFLRSGQASVSSDHRCSQRVNSK